MISLITTIKNSSLSEKKETGAPATVGSEFYRTEVGFGGGGGKFHLEICFL